MAMAGPAANFTLMFLAVIAIQVVLTSTLQKRGMGRVFGRVLLVLFELNLLLGLFNCSCASARWSSAIMFS